MGWGGPRENSGKPRTYLTGKADYRLSIPLELAEEVEKFARELDRKIYDEKVKNENKSTN